MCCKQQKKKPRSLGAFALQEASLDYFFLLALPALLAVLATASAAASVSAGKLLVDENASLRKDATAFDWLMDKINRAYEGEEQSYDGLFIYCRMLFGRKDHRSCSAEINFDDIRDEPIGLAAAIHRAMLEEKNRVPST